MGKGRSKSGVHAPFWDPTRSRWRGVVLWVDPSGVRRRAEVTSVDQKKCFAKIRALESEIERHGAPAGKSPTIEVWAVHWLETVAKPRLGPSAFTNARTNVKLWIIPTLGGKRVSAVTASDVRRLRQVVLDAGRASQTATHVHNTLSSMLQAAMADGLVDRNVTELAKPPRGMAKAGAKTREALSSDSVADLLRVSARMPDMAGAIWWWRLLTGRRQGELLGATLEDVDLEEGVWHVRRQLQEITREHGCAKTAGKDGRWRCGYKRAASCPEARWRVPEGYAMTQVEGRLHLVKPKSGSGPVVPLVPPLVVVLRRWLEHTKDWPRPHGLLFCHPDGRPIIGKHDEQGWRELLAEAGVILPREAVAGGTDLTGHVSRHTVVTALAELGVDFQVIGKIVGHGSVAMTGHYRHARSTEFAAAMGKLDEAWGLVEIEGWT